MTCPTCGSEFKPKKHELRWVSDLRYLSKMIKPIWGEPLKRGIDMLAVSANLTYIRTRTGRMYRLRVYLRRMSPSVILLAHIQPSVECGYGLYNVLFFRFYTSPTSAQELFNRVGYARIGHVVEIQYSIDVQFG